MNDHREEEFERMATIDLEEGASRMGGSLESAKKITAMLAESLPADINELTQAATANDIDMLRGIAHKLYGGLCYCGAPKLRALVERFQHDLANENYQNINVNIERISKESERVITKIKQGLEA